MSEKGWESSSFTLVTDVCTVPHVICLGSSVLVNFKTTDSFTYTKKEAAII